MVLNKQNFQFNEKVAEAFKKPNSGAGGLNDYLGIRIIDVGPGTMHGCLDVRDDFMTMIGNMHGGVLSAFSDHMLGCVCYPVMKKGQWAATTEFKINLMAPVIGGVVDGYAEIINMTRAQAVVQVELENESRLVALAQGTVTIRDPR